MLLTCYEGPRPDVQSKEHNKPTEISGKEHSHQQSADGQLGPSAAMQMNMDGGATAMSKSGQQSEKRRTDDERFEEVVSKLKRKDR